MDRTPAFALKMFIAVVALSLGGCVTYYQPRYADDGVYYGDEYYGGYSRSRAVDPVYYPYWSLDYFYFSYYRHPYSVVYYHDPFFRPYPGWYYGYRPGPRFRFAVSFGHWYPWYGAGFYYHYYRPWYWHHHYHYHFHHHAKPAVESRKRAVAGSGGDRGRSLYQAQQRDARESFTVDGDRRTMRTAGVPRPGDRTAVTSLSPLRTPADRRPASGDRTTRSTGPAAPSAERRASPRGQAPQRPTDTRSRAPRSRTPEPGTQPRALLEQGGIPLPERGRARPRRDVMPAASETMTPPHREGQQLPSRIEGPRPESAPAPLRRPASAPVEQTRSAPASPPPAPPPSSAPQSESAPPPDRSRSESGGERRRPR